MGGERLDFGVSARSCSFVLVSLTNHSRLEFLACLTPTKGIAWVLRELSRCEAREGESRDWSIMVVSSSLS